MGEGVYSNPLPGQKYFVFLRKFVKLSDRHEVFCQKLSKSNPTSCESWMKHCMFSLKSFLEELNLFSHKQFMEQACICYYS